MTSKYIYQGYTYNSDIIINIDELDQHVFKENIMNDTGNNYIKPRSIYFLFTVLFTFPFIIVDTYFAYTNISCQNYYIPGINISLDIWLIVIAYTLILSIILEMYVIFFEKLRENIYYNIINFTYYSVQIFIIGWMVVGTYIYWHNYTSSHICSKSINSYIWIRLICGLAICILKLYTIYL